MRWELADQPLTLSSYLDVDISQRAKQLRVVSNSLINVIQCLPNLVELTVHQSMLLPAKQLNGKAPSLHLPNLRGLKVRFPCIPYTYSTHNGKHGGIDECPFPCLLETSPIPQPLFNRD